MGSSESIGSTKATQYASERVCYLAQEVPRLYSASPNVISVLGSAKILSAHVSSSRRCGNKRAYGSIGLKLFVFQSDNLGINILC